MDIFSYIYGMEDRYFMVWFHGTASDGEIIHGNSQVIGKRGSFINEEETTKLLEDINRLTGVFIENFVEFPNEEDFKTYVKTKEGDLGRFKFW